MKRTTLFVSISAILLGVDATPVVAEQKATLEQVIVTSRRTEESVQEVPLAVSALTADMLESKGIARMNDLVQSTPAVTSQPTSGRMGIVNFGIRGQRNTDVLPTSDPSVIVYIADVPQMRGYGLGTLGSLDIQSVEVLKGPQGTLFGRSTTGGAIVITPNAPTHDFAATVGVGFGERNREMAKAIVNAPITDTIAARIAVQSEKADGYIDNKGTIGRDTFNDRDELSWRGALQFEPTDALTSTFYTDGFQSSDNGPMVQASSIIPATQAGIVLSTYNGTLAATGGNVAAATAQANAMQNRFNQFNAAVAADQDPYSGTTNLPNGFSNITVYGISNTTSYEISDSLSLKNIIGYRYIHDNDLWDLDGTNVAVLDVHNVQTTHQYSEEFQVSGTQEKLDWMTGIFLFKEYAQDNSFVRSLGGTSPSLTGSFGSNISKSIFGQVIYHFTDDLNLTLGLRENNDLRYIKVDSRTTRGTCAVEIAPGQLAPNDHCVRDEDKTFSEPSYNITLDYHLDVDKMVYVAHRHGYRAGGFNGRAAQDVTFKPFKPETVDDIEIGFKGDMELAGRPLRVNAAAFYSDYKEIQRLVASVTNTGALATNVVNAATAKLFGGELETTFLPIDSVQIDLFFSYIHAKYDKWEDPLNADPTQRDKSHESFPVPIRSGGLTVKYTLPTPAEWGTMSIQGNVYAQAETQLADDNGVGGLQPGYSLVGARADWADVMGTKLKLGLWGKNLNNTQYYSGGVNVEGTLGYYMAYPGVPQSWGIDATYEF